MRRRNTEIWKEIGKLVEDHGYTDVAEALKAGHGWPDSEDVRLTGNRAKLDDYAPCKITRKEDW